MIFHKNKNYTVQKQETGEDVETGLKDDCYALFYKGKLLPDQISSKVEEPGIEGVTTITVTFEL